MNLVLSDRLLGERIVQRQFEANEGRRVRSLTNDKTLRVEEYKETRSFDTDEEIRKARALAGINQEFGAATATQQPESFQEAITKLTQEIARVNGNPALTNEQKHLQTRALQQSINRIIDQNAKQAERR